MGVRKGTDNFKTHREVLTNSTEESLRLALESSLVRKIFYSTKGALVADMAQRLGVHRTTLGRNEKYSRMLLSFFSRQQGASLKLEVKNATPEVLRLKVMDADIRIGRLEHQLSQATRLQHIASRRAPLPSNDIDAYAAFGDLVWVLKMVIDRINIDAKTLDIDFQRYEILDLAAAPGRQVIVAGRRVRSFIDAYKLILEQERGDERP
jgi:DNA-binding XRE family transcriptional regulator